jgi:hypothetical protein
MGEKMNNPYGFKSFPSSEGANKFLAREKLILADIMAGAERRIAESGSQICSAGPRHDGYGLLKPIQGGE